MVNLKINLSKKEINTMWHDIIKFLTVAIIVHLLYYIVDDHGELFSEYVLKFFLYAIMGLVIYYLIVKKSVDNYLLDKPKTTVIHNKHKHKKHRKDRKHNKVIRQDNKD